MFTQFLQDIIYIRRLINILCFSLNSELKMLNVKLYSFSSTSLLIPFVLATEGSKRKTLYFRLFIFIM